MVSGEAHLEPPERAPVGGFPGSGPKTLSLARRLRTRASARNAAWAGSTAKDPEPVPSGLKYPVGSGITSWFFARRTTAGGSVHAGVGLGGGRSVVRRVLALRDAIRILATATVGLLS